MMANNKDKNSGFIGNGALSLHNFLKTLNKYKLPIILFLIVMVSVFLRTYHFSDWLRFNADQSRDAALAISVVENKADLPLLGPKAGGTGFKLGPIFYYFQITSVKIFGAEPDKAAYPDLFFSILAIPLFFLLARIYFNPKISLALTWIYATAYFAVKYSRFAWNTNSTPFFVMLFIYSFYKIINSEGNKKYFWIILSGISLGICVQLHASLLIILPVLAILILTLLFKKGKIAPAGVAIFLAAAVLVNIPQIIGEVKTKGANSYQFISGATSKSERNASLKKNVFLNLSCHIKSNNHILTSLGNENECGYNDILRKINKIDSKKLPAEEKILFVLFLIISPIFPLGGYFLLFYRTKNEPDSNKKILLGILSAYAAISFIFFFFWATELSVRFFLTLSFVPFFLLGFWMEFLSRTFPEDSAVNCGNKLDIDKSFLWGLIFHKKVRDLSKKFKKEWFIIALVVVAVSFFNLQKIHATYKDLRYGGGEINGDFDYITLGEANYIADYLKNNSHGEKILHIDAQAGYLFKILRPLQFLTQKEQLKIIQLEKEIKLNKGERLFYVKSADSECHLPKKTLEKYEIENCSSFRQFSIFSLRVK